MLLVSSSSSMDEFSEARYLAAYTNHLREALAERGLQTCAPTENQVKDMYELCLLDYVRFMAGWGFWGNDRYARQRATGLLRCLDGGKPTTEDGYVRAVYDRYPLPADPTGR